MNLEKFTKLLRVSENNFTIHAVRRDPIKKVLHVTVEYVGEHAGRLKVMKIQKDVFYKEKAKDMIDKAIFLMPHVKPRVKSLKVHVRRTD